MTEQKHTPEPWIVRYGFNVFDKSGDRAIGSCGGYQSNGGDGQRVHNENEANAARIVATVNAMAGVPNPAAFVAAARNALASFNAWGEDDGSDDGYDKVCKAMAALAAALRGGGE